MEQSVQQLKNRCLDIAADDLLVFTAYTEDDIRHEYVAEVLGEDIDRVAMDALHHPILNVHRILQLVRELNPLGGDHQISVHFYEFVTYVHIPTGDRSGAIVSLDRRSDRYREVCSAVAGDAV